MKFKAARGVDPQVFDCANPKPGIYRSDRGSWLIKPENNVTNRGNVGTQSEYVLISDVDTGKTVIKHCSEVKGNYTYVAPLSAVEVSVGATAAGCGCGF